ncbi:hypothetical protein CMI41_02135 [Candidatus Pacearchaeota archaeon]|nr:hypothetical protein [Candidatus Pacearchaeota archaeon]|tara:strand:+ start:2760 stop:3419 length:660 start_codon:yes stop_codon:yes gene_type:complete
MPTIAHLTEKIIEQKPFLIESLSEGIVNHAALAEKIKPEIEKELKKKVKFGAVNMSIRRLSEKLEKSFVKQTMFNTNSDITLKSDLVEITLFKLDNIQDKLKKVYGIVNISQGDFLTITQGIHELMIITNKRHEEKVVSLFAQKNIKKTIRNLSSLTVNIPQGSVETLGLFYLVTRSLNWENINIVDIVSTLTEMTFIVSEDDSPKGFRALKKLIRENR